MILFPLKLVRDRIPEHIAAKGGKCIVKRLTGKPYRDALLRKLVEEAHEVACTKTRPEAIEELADMMEVANAVMVALVIGPDEIREVQRAKALKNGTFAKGTKLLVARCIK